MSQHLFNLFTWSMRRRDMFGRCLREYFYHYYGSAGGAFINTTEAETEKLHLLRSAAGCDEYVYRSLCEALRRLWESGLTAVPKEFLQDLEKRFAGEFRDMLFGKVQYDHKRPLLWEVTEPGIAPRELEEKILQKLRESCGLLISGALPRLLQIPGVSRIYLPFPLKVSWNGLDCFVTPLAAWHEGGELFFLCAGKESEENCALLSLYALEKFRIAPDAVRIFHLDSGNLHPAAMPLSFSGAFRRIREDADRMLLLELKLKSCRSAEALFPQNFKACERCRFRSFCL